MIVVEDISVEGQHLLRLLARTPAFSVRGRWRARSRPGPQARISEEALTGLISAGLVARGEANGIPRVAITRAGREVVVRLRFHEPVR